MDTLEKENAHKIQAPELVLREAFRNAIEEDIERRKDIALKILFPDENIEHENSEKTKDGSNYIASEKAQTSETYNQLCETFKEFLNVLWKVKEEGRKSQK